MRYVLLLILLLPFAPLQAQSDWQKAPLRDTSGAIRHLRLPGKKILVVLFLSPECPLCKRYVPRLRELQQAFRDEAVFAGIIPGKSYSLNAIKAYQNDFQIPFVLLKDDNLSFSRSLKTSVTPEVMLIGPDGAMLYRGLIDNGMAFPGKQRTVITEHYLADALMKKNKLTSTTPIGCLINDF